MHYPAIFAAIISFSGIVLVAVWKWTSSVERTMGSLDGRLSSLEDRLSSMEADMREGFSSIREPLEKILVLLETHPVYPGVAAAPRYGVK